MSKKTVSKKYKAISVLLCVALVFFIALPLSVSAGEAENQVWKLPRYVDYLKNAKLSQYDQEAVECLQIEALSDLLTYSFKAPKDGLYHIRVTYKTLSGSDSKPSVKLSIDGSVPFKEALSVLFDRIRRDADYNSFDRMGNQIRAEQQEVSRSITGYLSDNSGVANAPLLFAISGGSHVLKLELSEEPLTIEKLELTKAEEVSAYKDVLSQNGENPTNGVIRQAEEMYEKSDASIFPACDRSSASVEPVASDKVVFNYLPGGRHSQPGQWVTWKLSVPETGTYSLSFKFRQTAKDGGFSVKKLSVGNDINSLVTPFEEARFLSFPYQDGWGLKTLEADGEKAMFYLEKGDWYVKLQSAMGGLSDAVSGTDAALETLNAISRKIMMITGPVPDVYRDYKWNDILPEEISSMKELSGTLKSIQDNISKSSGGSGSFVSVFGKIINDLDVMTSDPSRIASKMSNFKVDLGALADWSMLAKEQPVDLDYIALTPYNQTPPDGDAGLFKNLWHQLKLFFASFFEDYSNEYRADADNAITVWMTSGGKDQASIIRQLINNDFTEQTGIPVNLEIVAAEGSGGLLYSTMAGVGPDVAMFGAAGDPMNYAIRGAVEDLSGYNDANTVTGRFSPQTLVPYRLDKKLYALPETMQYSMLFFRSDILDELGLRVPNTWDDVTDCIVRLQRNSMTFGLSADLSNYYMFLMQNGGQLYNDAKSLCAVDSPVGIASFKQWTGFYKDYSLNVQYDFVNRFRSGEMPLAIADYTSYNQLAVFAPEIKDLWGMAPIPGTMRDGAIDRSNAVSGTNLMLMSQSKNKQNGWEFMKWWSSDENQLAYARELEMTMGAAGRYPTANQDAFSKISWNRETKDNLSKQRNYAVGIPEIPGSYIVPRCLNFAFQGVVNEKEEPGQQLLKYVRDINKELKKKREEFGLELPKE